ncbi:alkaline phosphatase [Tessaracoccus caeni]|uniref:alkaline phosphatase n=1 Tax=Tessaracoccus caeni TaxID=3031239 RepID=UPI0023DA0F71|nr:alkaline phosphatase [Tessaracoccus caeni]MDF1487067.1 alkaline phosphatase [Tessaracoccus caeni]
MSPSPTRLLTGALTASAIVAGSAFVPLTASAAGPVSPKNVIVLIGDGMGYNHVDLANEVLTGKTHYQVITGGDHKVNPAGSNSPRPTTGFQSWDLVGMSTHWVDGPVYDPSKAWTDFEWIKDNPTDSAAAGTAMATGHKTYNAGIGVDKDGKVLENLSQRAKSLGKSAGVVSSVQFSHATPAAYSAHNESRQNLQALANEQLSGFMDVVIGAGHPYFDDNHQPTADSDFGYVSQADWERLTTGKTDYTFIEDKAAFEALTTGQTPEKVFGVPQVRSTLQQARAVGAERNDVPELATLTEGALNVLDDDEDGLFLMVEGGAIDWTGHANQTDRNAEETIEFFGAVESVIDWVETNSSWDETLVVVTADHETGYLNGPTAGTWDAIKQYPDVSWNSGNHTNQLAPFFFHGAGSDALNTLADQRDPIRGHYLDNTEMAQWLLTSAWADKEDPEPEPEPEVKTFSKASAPTIFGTATVGKTLRATVKSWNPAASYAFSWLRDGKAISGATGTAYKLTSADVGKKISVKVTGSKAGYASVSKTSTSVKVSKAVASVKVSVPSLVAKGKQATIKVAVSSAATSKPTGKVTVKVNGKTVTKSVSSSAKGAVSVKLPKISKKGSYKVTVSFKPSGDTAKSTSSSKSVTKTLKVSNSTKLK